MNVFNEVEKARARKSVAKFRTAALAACDLPLDEANMRTLWLAFVDILQNTSPANPDVPSLVDVFCVFSIPPGGGHFVFKVLRLMEENARNTLSDWQREAMVEPMLARVRRELPAEHLMEYETNALVWALGCFVDTPLSSLREFAHAYGQNAPEIFVADSHIDALRKALPFLRVVDETLWQEARSTSVQIDQWVEQQVALRQKQVLLDSVADSGRPGRPQKM